MTVTDDDPRCCLEPVFAPLVRAAERRRHIAISALEYTQSQVRYQERGLTPAQPIRQAA